MTSCTATVRVTSTAAATYASDTTTVATVGLDPPGSRSGTFTPVAVGLNVTTGCAPRRALRRRTETHLCGAGDQWRSIERQRGQGERSAALRARRTRLQLDLCGYARRHVHAFRVREHRRHGDRRRWRRLSPTPSAGSMPLGTTGTIDNTATVTPSPASTRCRVRPRLLRHEFGSTLSTRDQGRQRPAGSGIDLPSHAGIHRRERNVVNYLGPDGHRCRAPRASGRQAGPTSPESVR